MVVYRTDSGDTFRFDAVVFRVLERLAAGPASHGDLLALAREDAFEEDPEDLLAGMAQAGLIGSSHADR